MTQFQKPLVQANGCIQYPSAMQCAICFSHLRVASLALATFFARALLPVLLLLLPAMQVCPFVARCVAKGFCSQPKFCHSICRLCFCPRHVFASVFCHRCCHYICPRRFFSIHVALQIATAIAIAIAFALKVAIFVAIKFGRLIEHSSWILDNIYIYILICKYIKYICMYIYICYVMLYYVIVYYITLY